MFGTTPMTNAYVSIFEKWLIFYTIASYISKQYCILKLVGLGFLEVHVAAVNIVHFLPMVSTGTLYVTVVMIAVTLCLSVYFFISNKSLILQ